MPWNQETAQRLGKTLGKLRNERDGISQEKIAAESGITKNQVQLIEAGRASGKRGDEGYSNPRLSTLVGLAEAFGMTVAELMEAADL